MKTAIFDLGGVLFTNGTAKFIKEFAKEHGLSEADVKYVIDGELGTQYRENKITAQEFWDRGLKDLNIGGERSKYEEQWINSYEIIEGTESVIKELVAKGFDVYYLSDNVKERVDLLNSRFGFLAYFKGGIFSHELGVRKPHPRIYEAIINKFKLDPSDSVFVDDKEINLPPAKEKGFKTILFVNPTDLRDKLIGQGFNI